MLFFYDPHCKEDSLEISGENFDHLIKARRATIGEKISGRNFQDSYLYHYKIESIEKKKALLKLIKKEITPSKITKNISLAWCVVDNKTVEKSLPFLNELGVRELFFIYSKRSQKNIKINKERCEKILINSSCQCGRDSIMNLVFFDSLESFLKKYPSSSYLNFGGRDVVKADYEKPIIVGPEGGFSQEDLKALSDCTQLGLDHPLVLRSETAIVSLASFGSLF